LQLAEERTCQVFLPGKPPWVEIDQNGLLVLWTLLQEVLDVTQDRGFSGAPRAIEGEHQTVTAGISTDAIGQTLCERRMPEQVVFRVETRAVGREYCHGSPRSKSPL